MSVTFHDTTLQDYKDLVNSGKIVKQDLYFVKSMAPDNERNEVPYLLFKGTELVGNSGVVVQKSVDGFLTVNKDNGSTIQVNIFDPVDMSTHIIGIRGQSLYIINEFKAKDTNGESKTSHATYLYYWDEDLKISNKNSQTETYGSWVNANINFTSSIMIGDIQFDAVKLGKLLDLLV